VSAALAVSGAAEGEVQVAELGKRFAGRDGAETIALAGIDFTIPAGQFVAILGPSGCGKSTLLRIIAGLTEATTGSIRIGGRAVQGPDPVVGIAFQRPVLLPWLTVRQNIAMPAELDGAWAAAEIARRVDALLAMVRLPDAGTKMPNELSGGMQQRVAIARALLKDPGVLLMDEPFGALDALTREHLHDELLAIWERRKPTVAFVTHDIAEAVYLADRVLVMGVRPGRIIADIRVPLARPRTEAVRGLPEFAKLGAELRALIPH